MLRTTSIFSPLRIIFENFRSVHGSCVSNGNCSFSKRKYLSRILINAPSPYKIVPGAVGKSQCKSQLLLTYNEFIHGCQNGTYCFMPHALRALEKLIRLIDEELQTVGCQKMAMPNLISADLWKQTERWYTPELFKLKDRHDKEFCLGPTHEELITTLFASRQISYKTLPLMLYQITRKFRDEKRPRYGLLRSREFEMKDLYTFDVDLEKAAETYDLICDTYTRIFIRLGLDFIKTEGSTGNIGGKSSHEFHLPADIGEDTIYHCKRCGFSANVELIDMNTIADDKSISCSKCSKLYPTNGIEVGHAFLLGSKYSSVFNATYTNAEQKPVVAEMGCYGLGVSRILQSSVEVFSKDNNIVWPSLIAPYQVCIIPNMDKNKKFNFDEIADNLYDKLNELRNLKGEIVIFDHDKLTIGKKLMLATQNGYPYVVVVGNKAMESPPIYELITTNSGETEYLSIEQVVHKLSEIETIRLI